MSRMIFALGLLIALVIAKAQDQQLTRTSVMWTTQSKLFANKVSVPTAKNCAYWLAVEVKGKCTADLMFDSSPRDLKCHNVGQDIVRCEWKLAK